MASTPGVPGTPNRENSTQSNAPRAFCAAQRVLPDAERDHDFSNQKYRAEKWDE